jgi:hypothetical protein
MNPIYSENHIKILVTEICKRYFYRPIGDQKFVLQNALPIACSRPFAAIMSGAPKLVPCSRSVLSWGRAATLKASRGKRAQRSEIPQSTDDLCEYF